MVNKTIQINNEKYGLITFTEHAIDGWLGSSIIRKSETARIINFDITKECSDHNSENPDFELKLKHGIDFYFQNEEKMMAIALKFLEQVLLINEDFDNKKIFKEEIKEDLAALTVEIINLFEYKFSLNFSLYNGYIECDVVLNHISENRFLVTGHSYNWVYRKF
jgi:hypothetical protein